MKILSLALLSVALVAGGAADAANSKTDTAKSKPKVGNAKVKKTAKAPVKLVCPVMGAEIASPSKASGKSSYKGKTYYFCCAGCKPAFDKEPAKYVKPVSNKKEDKKSVKKAEAKPSPKKVEDVLLCPVTGEKVASKEKASGVVLIDGKNYHFCCGGCKGAFDKEPAKYTAKLTRKVHSEIHEGE